MMIEANIKSRVETINSYKFLKLIDEAVELEKIPSAGRTILLDSTHTYILLSAKQYNRL